MASSQCCYCLEYGNFFTPLGDKTLVCQLPGPCSNRMHLKCFTIANTTRNIVCNTNDVKTIRSKTHDTEVRKHDQIQQIRINFMLQQREAFIAKENTARGKKTETGLELTPLKLKLRMVGTIARVPLPCVLSSAAIDEGGFVQRGISRKIASEVEDSMRKIGFDPLVGTIALVEIPWTAAEVSTLKGQNLMQGIGSHQRP